MPDIPWGWGSNSIEIINGNKNSAIQSQSRNYQYQCKLVYWINSFSIYSSKNNQGP